MSTESGSLIQNVRRLGGHAKARLKQAARSVSSRGGRALSAPALALAWLRRHELATGGVAVHSGNVGAYPEVTGYLVPTLLEYGERAMATRLVEWLICAQAGDGSYASEDGVPHVFDTGQVLRGLLAGIPVVPQARDAAFRTARYLVSQMVDGGARGFGPRYKGDIPETVHLYVLPALVRASEVLDDPELRQAALRCLDYYTAHPDFLATDHLTHFLAYEIEALIDLGRADQARSVLERMASFQRSDGGVRGVGRRRWVCSPGLAQLAICWYKTGAHEPADRAMAWLERRQSSAGGFRGSYGLGAAYFPRLELSWAVKFYLDAHLLRVRSFIDRNLAVFPDTVPGDDGRLQSVLELVQPGQAVAEIGCGKGRFLKALKDAVPDIRCAGVDLSPAMLGCLPPEIRGVPGLLESVPLPDESFDVVFSVEAIEHSSNPASAVAEMVRLVKPGGWVVIVDKQRRHWGRLECPPWERWPDRDELLRWIRKGCDEVDARPVSYGAPADGLMLAWRGRKRSRLTGAQWNRALIGESSRRDVVDNVLRHRYSEWAKVMLLKTVPGERVLEIGSGTGEISLQLARAGRVVTALDIDERNLDFTRTCAAELKAAVNAVQADACARLPFGEREFDTVWNSGLLEHFSAEERRAMIREWARVARRRLVTFVPYAGCVPYRLWKAREEEQGTWAYGLETPLVSLREDFAAAGVAVTEEFAIGAAHALALSEQDRGLHAALAPVLDPSSPDALPDLNQGYLLVTVGEIR